jgi:pimeloyl-ACP methyl ester carboxylesterase
VLNYRVEGNGPPLLLVHGFGISFNIWRQLAPLLRPHLRLVMVELPGIGASTLPPGDKAYLDAAVEGIEQLRQSLHIDRWAALGYSSGSRIAEAYAAVHFDHVCAAIFLCPITIDPHKRRGLAFGLWLDRHAPAIGTWILSGWRLRFLIAWLGFNLRRDARSAEWYAEISAAPVRVLKDTMRAVAENASGGFSVSVPYAMIWGDSDLIPFTPRTAGLHDYFVRGRHAAPVESAGEIAEVMLRFLSQAGC